MEKRAEPNQTIYADNCVACGNEYLSIELAPVKLSGLTLSQTKICMACLTDTPETEQQYREAIDHINSMVGSTDGV